MKAVDVRRCACESRRVFFFRLYWVCGGILDKKELFIAWYMNAPPAPDVDDFFARGWVSGVFYGFAQVNFWQVMPIDLRS